MASYPDLPLSYESTRDPVNGTEVDNADDDTIWVRNFHTETVYRFTLIHELLESSDISTLETFYDNNRDLAVSLTYKKDNASYTCYFVEPVTVDRNFATYWRAVSVLEGTKD